MAADHTKKTDAALTAEFKKLALDVGKGGDPWMVYMKCNSMRSLWHEMRKRNLTPPWEQAQQGHFQQLLAGQAARN